MNFYITLTKTRRKFDKYIKINRIRNKVIVDINELMDEYGVNREESKSLYFNLMLYTKINHALKKGKDIYYIPDYKSNGIKLSELFKLKETIEFEIDFNVLLFYDEFIDDEETLSEIINRIDDFTSSQIIKDY